MDASFGKVAAQQALRANPSYAAGRGAVTPLDFKSRNRYNIFSKESLHPVCIWDKPQGISCMGVLSVILVIRKRMIAGFALFCCFLAGFSALLWAGLSPEQAVFAPQTDGVPVTFVVDAGHGGEDGGAVSAEGVMESQVNLEVALRLNDLLRFTGQKTAMIRRSDTAICDAGLDTIRARKASDIRNRVALVNNSENAVLLSIHQNSLPSSPETHGAQVFWNRAEGAETLARVVQDALNGAINTERAKQPKRIPDTIYLMKHVEAPAVLVECGFLSNAAETAWLQEPSHQRKLAAAITAGCLRCLAGEVIAAE